MTSAVRSYEYVVGDDGTRQAFREVWELLDALTEGTGISIHGDALSGVGLTHAQVMSRVSVGF